jgi:hypothetical protein
MANRLPGVSVPYDPTRKPCPIRSDPGRLRTLAPSKTGQ